MLPCRCVLSQPRYSLSELPSSFSEQSDLSSSMPHPAPVNSYMIPSTPYPLPPPPMIVGGPTWGWPVPQTSAAPNLPFSTPLNSPHPVGPLGLNYFSTVPSTRQSFHDVSNTSHPLSLPTSLPLTRKRTRANGGPTAKWARGHRGAVLPAPCGIGPPAPWSLVQSGVEADTEPEMGDSESVSAFSSSTFNAAERSTKSRNIKRSTSATDIWYFMRPLDTDEEPPERPTNEKALTQKPKSKFVGCKLCMYVSIMIFSSVATELEVVDGRHGETLMDSMHTFAIISAGSIMMCGRRYAISRTSRRIRRTISRRNSNSLIPCLNLLRKASRIVSAVGSSLMIR